MNKQRGFSIFGLIFLVSVLAGVTIIAVKVLPPYMDYLIVVDATQQTIEQPRMALQANDKILEKIFNQLSINNINMGDIGRDAIKLHREDGVLTADIEYDVEKPVFTNEDVDITLTLAFAKSLEVRTSD